MARSILAAVLRLDVLLVVNLVDARQLHLQHLTDLEESPKAFRTYAKIEQDFLDFLDGLGVMPTLDQLNRGRLTEFESYAGGEPPHYCAERGWAIRAWARFLVGARVLKTDPFKIELPPSQQALQSAERRRQRESTELGQTVVAYLTDARLEGKSTETITTYRRALDWIVDYALAHGISTLAAMSPATVRAAAAEMRDPQKRGPQFKRAARRPSL